MKSNKLFYSSVVLSAVLILWIVFAIITGMKLSSGNMYENLLKIKHFHYINFILVLFISPLIIFLSYYLFKDTFREKSIRKNIGLIFLIIYSLLITISYSSQLLIPGWIEKSDFKKISIWFFYNSRSFVYFINQLGYFIWSIGSAVLFLHLLNAKGILRVIGILYYISIFLTAAAFIGLIFNNFKINSLTVVGGLLLLPIAVLTAIYSYNISKKKKS